MDKYYQRDALKLTQTSKPTLSGRRHSLLTCLLKLNIVAIKQTDNFAIYLTNKGMQI